jgi:hypothetical protein
MDEVETIVAALRIARSIPRLAMQPRFQKAVVPETFPFVVFFRETNDCIRILAVAHGVASPGSGRVASEHLPKQVLESLMHREKPTDLDAALARRLPTGYGGSFTNRRASWMSAPTRA